MRKREDRELVDQMAQIPLFRGSSRRDLTRICELGQHLELPDGWTFVQEHTPGDACYLILHGEARVIRGGQEVARLGPGELVGERAMVEHGLRSASVSAAGRVELLRLGYTELSRLLEDHPRLREGMLASYRKNLPADKASVDD